MRIDMKKKQILTGVVERVDFPNKAVVKAQVPQPDESVATEYRKRCASRTDSRVLRQESTQK